MLLVLSYVLSGCMEKDKARPEAEDSTEPALGQMEPETINHLGYNGHAASKLAVFSAAMPGDEKISTNLLYVEKLAKSRKGSFVNVAARAGMLIDQGGVVVKILLSRIDSETEKKLRKTGVRIRHLSITYKRVSVVISKPAQLHLIAVISEVRRIDPEYGARTRGAMSGKSLNQR